ncbi:MAG: glycosyltransferase [Bacteroidetes bacterium]|nr:glycosyltransferase [Bacteroidota bacterium]
MVKKVEDIMNFQKIAGVVILFNPDKSVIDNIRTYIDKLDILFVIDNSETVDEDIIQELKKNKKILYIPNNCNLGIAAALNTGVNCALDRGYKWLFTFDQDSKVSPTMIKSMIDFLNDNDTSNIGIISPFHSYNDYRPPPNNSRYSDVLIVPTSGNLLNLNSYIRIGPFLEELFIDYVDIEFCLRLHLNGYTIIRLNTAILLHKLGELKKKRFLHRYIAVTNHNAERMYYRVRNRFYVINKYKYKYPLYCLSVLKQTLGDVVKIIIYESDKIYKLKMMLLGSFHYIAGKYGKINF